MVEMYIVHTRVHVYCIHVKCIVEPCTFQGLSATISSGVFSDNETGSACHLKHTGYLIATNYPELD